MACDCAIVKEALIKALEPLRQACICGMPYSSLGYEIDEALLMLKDKTLTTRTPEPQEAILSSYADAIIYPDGCLLVTFKSSILQHEPTSFRLDSEAVKNLMVLLKREVDF